MHLLNKDRNSVRGYGKTQALSAGPAGAMASPHSSTLALCVQHSNKVFLFEIEKTMAAM